jgi:hypothetical protein
MLSRFSQLRQWRNGSSSYINDLDLSETTVTSDPCHEHAGNRPIVDRRYFSPVCDEVPVRYTVHGHIRPELPPGSFASSDSSSGVQES